MQDTEHEYIIDEEQILRDNRQYVYTVLKTFIFLIVWAFITILFMVTTPSKRLEMVVPLENNKIFTVAMENPKGNAVRVEISGNINAAKTDHPRLASEGESHVVVNFNFWETNEDRILWKSKDWLIYFDDDIDKVVNNFDLTSFVEALSEIDDYASRLTFLNLHNATEGFSIRIVVNPCDKIKGVWLGSFLLVFLYILIIFEITDRTFATLFTSILSLAILSALHERFSMPEIISWINISTLMVLFGMMILVAILSDTGFFDYMAVVFFDWSGGKTWRLLFHLCLFTTICSTFLINVTIILMMTPVTIRICEIMRLDTRSALILIVIFTNIGGALTPVGDTANMMVATNPVIRGSGVKYGTFTLHMFPGVFLSFFVAFLLVYYMLRNRIDSEKNPLQKVLEELKKRQKGKKLKRTLSKRIVQLQELVENEAEIEGSGIESFEKNLRQLKTKYQIRDKWLLVKCVIAFIFLTLTLFLNSLPCMPGATLEWTAILAAWLLIILDNRKDFETILERVDWSTLIFFGSLFILVEVLAKLGFVDFWNELIVSVIKSASAKHHSILSMVIMIWVSAIFSAGIENIPITAVLIKLTIHISTCYIGVAHTPLVWGLMYGVSFGANGTLLGGLANLVMAGLASQYGYRIKLMHFSKIGFPVMLSTVTVATIYLIIAHSLFTWHESAKVLTVNTTNYDENYEHF